MKPIQNRNLRLASILISGLPIVLATSRAMGQAGANPIAPPPVNGQPTTNSAANLATTNTATPANAAGGSETPTGSPTDVISLEYRNAPLVEVLRTLAEGANINITLSGEVEKGSPVSIRLNKVTYEQALKAILDTYNFGSVVENGILKIDKLENLNKIRDEKLKEKEAAWKSQPSKRLVWQVNYAKATELQNILNQMLKGYSVDPRFSIVSDKRTNKLIIEGISDALVEAKAILENLDRRKQQVLIEARIVEASNELSKTLSVTWGTRFGFDGTRGLANGLIFPNSMTGSIGGAGALGASAPSPGLATSPTQLGTLQFTVGSINNLVNIDAVLRAYETESLANVIASPRVVVQDQEKAVIKENVNLSRPVLGPDGKPGARSTVATLSLTVSPQVTSENTLELDIDVQRATPTNAPTDPVQGSINREAQTKLIVSNGETAVIGGLYQTQKFKGQGRVPFLGRLPIIGALFRTNEEQSFRSELMVLITPRILPGGPGRSTARADLPILGGSSGGSSGGGNNSGGGDNAFNNSGDGGFGNSGGGSLNSGSTGGAAKTNTASSGLGNTGNKGTGNVGGGAATGADNLGSANDFGADVGNGGGNGADLGGGTGKPSNSANASGAGNSGDDFGNSGNSGGGDAGGADSGGGGGNFNNLGPGGNAPAGQPNAGGGNNLDNLDGSDL